MNLISSKFICGTLLGKINFLPCLVSITNKASGAIIVFDITNQKSFDSCKDWHKKLVESGEDTVEIILIGNKSDLAPQRQVSKEEAQEFADQHNMPYIETSVLQNQNVSKAFETLLNRIVGTLKKMDFKSRSSLTNTNKYTVSSPHHNRVFKQSIALNHQREIPKLGKFQKEEKSCKC